MNALRVRTPAKVNLFLRVLSRRADGYHNLETLFQAIDLEDELVFQKTASETSLCVPEFPNLETADNLILRAVRSLETDTGRKLSVRITLNKRIPVAAGLGGGSSDAAATLIGISTLFALDLPEDYLFRTALALGADVPFFLMGGTAVGEGVGERLTPVASSLDYGIVLVNPGFPVSTATVFREFSKSLTGTSREATLWNVLRESSVPEDLLHNDLQVVTETLHPEIHQACRAMERAGIRKPLMSGSGPTVFGLTGIAELARVKERLGPEWNAVAARPLNRGVVMD